MFKVWKPTKTEPIIPSDKEKQYKIKNLRKMIISSNFDLRTDDIYMTRWLHCRDWDIDAAFKRVEKFVNFKKENPDWFITQPIPAYEFLLKKNIAMILDGRDRKGRRVYLIRGNRLNPDTLSIQEMSQINNIWLESIADELETIENGMVVLLDMKDFPWKLCKWFTPKNSKLSGKSTGLAPFRNFVIHLVNISPMCTALLGMVSPFFSTELKSKFCLHFNDMSFLHKCLGREILPEEYGGIKKLDCEQIYRDLCEKYLNNKDYYAKNIYSHNKETFKQVKDKNNIILSKERMFRSNQKVIAALD